jgi:hypothetical protein
MAETRRKKQAAGMMHGCADEISEILKLLGNPQVATRKGWANCTYRC